MPDRVASIAAAVPTVATVDDWIRLVRPRQWIKNTFVLAPLLFSGQATDPRSVLAALAACLLFCALASGIYCWNDIADHIADRAHPSKRARPIAAGAISTRAGLIAGTTLVVLATTGAWLLAPRLGWVFIAYLAANVLYTMHLKVLVIVDVFAIASFFILRLLAGCAAIQVVPSVWLLLCGGLLSLYLGFSKRRQELGLLGSTSHNHRSVLAQYDTGLLDQMNGILLAVTIIAYIMYTLTSRTAEVVGSETLSYSTVFVLYGVFRYLYLVHRTPRVDGGDTAELLLTDRPLLVAVFLWLAYCGWAVYRPF